MGLMEDLVQSIGGTILRMAREQASDGWDYAGYVFATTDGQSIQSSAFLFRDGALQEFSVRPVRLELREAHLRLREVMRLEGDAPWISSNAVVRREDLNFKQIYEFDDAGRWIGGPMSVSQKFDLLIRDVFPDATRPDLP